VDNITKQKYLEDRTAKFAEKVIDVVNKIPQDAVNKKLISQIVASSSSIGANYLEATEGESRKDFIHKIGICRKETKETLHWIRLLNYNNKKLTEEFKLLWDENRQLLLIFSKIIQTCKTNVQ
jgi:four helix bundle protein